MIAHARVIPRLVITIAVVACTARDGPTASDPVELPTSTGGFLFKTRTTGTESDPDGYRIVMSSTTGAGSYGFAIGTNDSLVISHQSLAPFTRFLIQLRGVAPNCWPGPLTGTQVAIIWNAVTPMEFSLDCTGPGHIFEYDRVTPHHANSIAWHNGSLIERYAFSTDGSFRLQYTSARYGAFEYSGSYGFTSPSVMWLNFDTDAEPEAVGTVNGDELSVEYDIYMVQADFEPGLFVRRRVSASR